MKVLILATDMFFKGGIQRYSRYQYKALKELYGKENVFVFSLLGEREGCFEEKLDIEYIQGGISLKDKIQFLYSALKFIGEKRIDLVIINHRQLAIIGFLAKKLFGSSYFTNVYGLEIWSGMKSYEEYALLGSDFLIGDCNFILNYIYRYYKYPRDRLKLLYDPVDTERFIPKRRNSQLLRKYGIPEDKFIVLTIGRLDRNKGHEVVIRALSKLEKDIIYVVVGDGRLRRALESLAIELKVVDRMFFTGRVPESELVDFYNIGDVVVLLSTFGKNEGEGLPLGLIEAAACGKPIIAGNQDGSVDAISEEYPNGFLIDPLNVEELVKYLRLYFRNPELKSFHGKNGRVYVEQNFSYENFKKRFSEIIKGISYYV